MKPREKKKKMKGGSKIPYSLRMRLFYNPDRNGAYPKLSQRTREAKMNKRKGVATGAEMISFMRSKDQEVVVSPKNPGSKAHQVGISPSIHDFEE